MVATASSSSVGRETVSRPRTVRAQVPQDVSPPMMSENAQLSGYHGRSNLEEHPDNDSHKTHGDEGIARIDGVELE